MTFNVPPISNPEHVVKSILSSLLWFCTLRNIKDNKMLVFFNMFYPYEWAKELQIVFVFAISTTTESLCQRIS